MIALIYLCGVLFILYGMCIFLIILIKNCTLSEARTILASFFRENSYLLSNDHNYMCELNKIVLDVLGEERYKKMCVLEEHSSTIFFEESNSGLSSINIVVSVSDDNEKLQLENLVNSKTKFYLNNYKLKEIVTYVEWDTSKIFGYPLLKITYPQTDDECERIRSLKNVEIKNIISSSSDIIDDSEDLL